MTAFKPSQDSSLPTHPDPENLRKQAKSLLKAFRSKDETTFEILKHLKKFKEASGAEIFADDLCLRECQHALALYYGFKSWSALIDSATSQSGFTPGDEINLVNSILEESVTKGASDIHFEWKEGRLGCRLRVDGELRIASTGVPSGSFEAVIDRIKELAALDLDIKSQPQHGNARIKVNGRFVCLRISVIPYVTGESIVVRLWTDEYFNMSFDQLSLTEQHKEIMTRLINSPNGIIAFSGPLGSGKTTTLYGVISKLDPAKRKVVTIENPVYRLIEGINQMQVDPAAGITIPKAIKAQMNQDPDVMAVLDCDDGEILELICQAALTGHLVITLLNASSASNALSNLKDMSSNRYQLASGIIGVVSQRLVRRICENCKEPHPVSEWEAAALGIAPGTVLYAGKGCDKCGGSGYAGRLAVYEIIEINDKLRKVIVENAAGDKIKRVAEDGGMISMLYDGLNKAREGLTSAAEILRVCC